MGWEAALPVEEGEVRRSREGMLAHGVHFWTFRFREPSSLLSLTRDLEALFATPNRISRPFLFSALKNAWGITLAHYLDAARIFMPPDSPVQPNYRIIHLPPPIPVLRTTPRLRAPPGESLFTHLQPSSSFTAAQPRKRFRLRHRLSDSDSTEILQSSSEDEKEQENNAGSRAPLGSPASPSRQAAPPPKLRRIVPPESAASSSSSSHSQRPPPTATSRPSRPLARARSPSPPRTNARPRRGPPPPAPPAASLPRPPEKRVSWCPVCAAAGILLDRDQCTIHP